MARPVAKPKIKLSSLQDELKKVELKKAKKKSYKWSYWFCIMDANNKMKTMLADINYELNTRENMIRLEKDLNAMLAGNYRCLVNFYLIKKFSAEDKK